MSTKVELLSQIEQLKHQNDVLRNENEILQRSFEKSRYGDFFGSATYQPTDYFDQYQPNSFWVQPMKQYVDDYFKPISRIEQRRRGYLQSFPWLAAEDICGMGVPDEPVVEYRDTEETKQKVREMAALIETLEQKLENAKAPLMFVVEAIKNKARFVSPAAAYELFEQMDYIFKDCKPWNASVGQLKEFLLREKNKALLPPPSSAIMVTDEQMADAISNICGEGLPLDEKQKWMGVCCLVRARYGYPYDFEACCNRLAKLPYKKSLYKECDWGSVRKLAVYSFCQEPYDKWRNYCPKKSESKYFDNCYYVARSLENELEKLQNAAVWEY